MDASELKPGLRLQDNRIARTVVLRQRINPMGTLVGPWWWVERVDTGRRTLILERTLRNGRRWTRV